MRTTNRLIATATALMAIGTVLAGCTSPVSPAVTFPREKLTVSLPRAVVGNEFTETLPEAMGGEQGLVYSLLGTVPGLTFDAATRVLSGTPTTPGRYDMTYTAKDSATGGTMESVTFTIAVDNRPLTNRERIIGTWQQMNDWWHDDERGTRIDYLTFTETRFILVRSHFESDGSLDHSWQHQGTWEITDRDVVRIWYHNHDDDDDTEDIRIELRKAYVLVGDDDLIINHWADESGEDAGSDWMTRVSDASLSSAPLGVWVMEEDFGDGLEIFTMTVHDDGRFEYKEEFADGSWTLTARWDLDLDNYLINLTDITETETRPGEEPVPSSETIGAYMHFAYAPMAGEAGERTIRVSAINDHYVANPRDKYGNYWRTMTLQQ